MASVSSSEKKSSTTKDPDHVDEKLSREPDTTTIHVEDTIEPENEITGLRLVVIHAGVTLAGFLAGLDSNVIATAIPVITSQFDSIGDVGWYGAAFYIVMCTNQPMAGKLYTLFDKKLVFLIYLFIFEIGNLVCALAPTSNALIAGRAVAGLGAAGVFVGGIVVISTIIPLHKRAMWQGIQVAMFSVASIVGPLIGGALTEYTTWRWCFYINLPCGAVAAGLMLFFTVRKPEAATAWPLARKMKTLDVVGFTLLAGAVTMLLLAFQFAGVTYAWNSSVIIGLFVGFGVTLIPFVLWQIHQGDNALIPPRLFAHRNAALLLASQAFGAGPFQVVIYWLPIWFQAVLRVSPLASGIRYIPTVVADAIFCLVGSGFIMQLGIWNPFLLFSNAMLSIAGGLLSTLYPGISYGHWTGYEIIGGIGYGLINNVGHIGMQASLPKELVPIGASSLMSVLSATCAIYLALGQTIFQDRLKANLSGEVSTQLIDKLLSSGATNIQSVTPPEQLPVVINGYSESITQVFYLTAAAPVLGFLIALPLKWTSLKKKEEPAAEGTVDESNGRSDMISKADEISQ